MICLFPAAEMSQRESDCREKAKASETPSIVSTCHPRFLVITALFGGPVGYLFLKELIKLCIIAL